PTARCASTSSTTSGPRASPRCSPTSSARECGCCPRGGRPACCSTRCVASTSSRSSDAPRVPVAGPAAGGTVPPTTLATPTSGSVVSVAHDTPLDATGRRPVRVLGIFAHPDDETLCAGGTLAKYASTGADVRVVSLTKGGAGQIRDAGAATRATLAAAREREFHVAGTHLGLTETRCLDYPDGELSDIDARVLVELVSQLLGELDPDVVITFGPDGFSGHPDHVAVGEAVTAACYTRRSSSPTRLFHCHRPHSRMLLRDRLAGWVVEMTTRFKGTKDFVHAM